MAADSDPRQPSMFESIDTYNAQKNCQHYLSGPSGDLLKLMFSMKFIVNAQHEKLKEAGNYNMSQTAPCIIIYMSTTF